VSLKVSCRGELQQKSCSAVYRLLDAYLNRFSSYPQKKRREISVQLLEGLGRTAPLLKSIHPGYRILVEGDLDGSSAVESDSAQGRFSSVIARFLINIAAAEKGLVLFLDDYPHCDKGSREIIEIFASSASSCRAVLALSAGENVRGGAIPSLSRLYDAVSGNDCIDIAADPLSADAHRELVARLTEENYDSSSVADAVYEKSGGLPFFTIEIVRQLFSRGMILVDSGKAALREGALDSCGQGESAEKILSERIARLDDQERLFLSCASVTGKRFYPETVAEYFSEEINATRGSGEKICRRALSFGIIERGEYGSFQFSHDTLHLLFYNAIDGEKRKSLHLSIARVLERSAPRDDAALFELAWHYIRSGNTEKALEYVFPAGISAMNKFAYDDALSYFTFCLNHLKDSDAVKIQALQNIAEIHISRGRSRDAADLLAPFLDGELSASGELYEKQSRAFYKMGDFPEAEKSAQKGLSLLGESLPDGILRIAGGTVIEAVKYFISRILPCRRASEEAASRYRLSSAFYMTLCRGYSMYDIPRFVYCVFRMRSIASRKLRGSTEEAFAITAYAGMLMALKRFRRADILFLRAL
ncbi:MAG: ATP-binding protein, partial [Spirochaetota bacterium]